MKVLYIFVKWQNKNSIQGQLQLYMFNRTAEQKDITKCFSPFPCFKDHPEFIFVYKINIKLDHI